MMARVLIASLLWLAATLAYAADGGTAWSALPPEEQRVLAPFAEQWDGLDTATQEKLRHGAARWVRMTPE